MYDSRASGVLLAVSSLPGPWSSPVSLTATTARAAG